MSWFWKIRHLFVISLLFVLLLLFIRYKYFPTGKIAGSTSSVVATVTISVCGNHEIDQGEDCDGNNLHQQSCQKLGYQSGKLSCDTGCKLNIKNCLPSKITPTGSYQLPKTGISSDFEDPCNSSSSLNLLKCYLKEKLPISIVIPTVSILVIIIILIIWKLKKYFLK